MDGTEGSKDTQKTALGGSSGGTKGTSKDKGKLYTEAQIAKIKSDAAAEAGRQRKAAEVERDNLKQDLQSTQSRLDALEREMNDSRLAEARGDPDELRKYQREQSVAKRERDLAEKERELARREAQVKADGEAIAKDKSVVHIAYIAAKHGLDQEELESLGISDEETLDRVAEKLAAGKSKDEGGEGEGGGEDNKEGQEFIPDSGVTSGTTGKLTPEQFEKLPISQKQAYLDKQD